jgi:hypothetical protein
MRRALTLFLVLLSFCWQAAAMGDAAAPRESGADLAHALLHWGEQAHHHHDDGSLAVDDSDASLAHVHLEGAASCVAILGAPGWAPAAFAAQAPPDHASARPPSRALPALRKPPRLLA